MTQDTGASCGPCSTSLRSPEPCVSALAGDDPSRVARCSYCYREERSNPALPFFEARGLGSPWSLKSCAVCGCHEVAHHPRGDDAPLAQQGKYPSVIGVPHPFAAGRTHEFDSFYCGCRGWD